METDAQIKARIDAALKDVNATEATWAAWAKGHKATVILGSLGLLIAIVVIAKLV